MCHAKQFKRRLNKKAFKAFSAGFLARQQNMKEVHDEHKTLPTPKHDRVQVNLILNWKWNFSSQRSTPELSTLRLGPESTSDLSTHPAIGFQSEYFFIFYYFFFTQTTNTKCKYLNQMIFSLSFQKVMIVASDGVSDDDFGQQATHLHDRMLVKIAALTTRGFYRFAV